MNMTVDWMMTSPPPPRAGRCSLLLQLPSSRLGLLWVLLPSQEFNVRLWRGRQRPTHLDKINLVKNRTKSTQSGWQTCRPPGIHSVSSPFSLVLFILSFHIFHRPPSLLPHLPLKLSSLPCPFFLSLFCIFHLLFLVFTSLGQSSPPFLSYTTSTFSWRGLWCSADCMVIICSYTLIWVRVQTCTWPAKCFVERKKKKITPQWVISGWANLISLGTLIMERTWIMNGVYNTSSSSGRLNELSKWL